jgi:hypothetical protein
MKNLKIILFCLLNLHNCNKFYPDSFLSFTFGKSAGISNQRGAFLLLNSRKFDHLVTVGSAQLSVITANSVYWAVQKKIPIVTNKQIEK